MNPKERNLNWVDDKNVNKEKKYLRTKESNVKYLFQFVDRP